MKTTARLLGTRSLGLCAIALTALIGFGLTACKVTIDAEGAIRVEHINLDKDYLEMNAGDTAYLTATVQPHNATNKKLDWHSDDSYVASVSGNGETVTVRAEHPGATNIRVTTADGGFTRTCYVVVSSNLNGSVSIGGSPVVGQTLWVNTDSLGGTGDISYYWMRGSNEIGWGSTYTVQSADVGYTITVTVTRDGYYNSVTSLPTATVTNGPSRLTGTVSITGDAVVGQRLEADTSSLEGEGAISYLWKREGDEIGRDSYYTVQSDDVGSTITVTVTRDGYSGSVTSLPVTIQEGKPATISITFEQIADAAPSITVPTLYRVSNGGPTSETLTVDEPEQYDSISWRVDNTSETGTGESFTLSADNPAYNLIADHFVTVMVMKDGVPYNKTVSFKIEY